MLSLHCPSAVKFMSNLHEIEILPLVNHSPSDVVQAHSHLRTSPMLPARSSSSCPPLGFDALLLRNLPLEVCDFVLSALRLGDSRQEERLRSVDDNH
jgi:hypothetical protein